MSVRVRGSLVSLLYTDAVDNAVSGAPDDAGRFLSLISPRRQNGSTCCSQTTVYIVTQGKAYHQSELTWR